MPPCPRLQAVQMLPWAAAPLVHICMYPAEKALVHVLFSAPSSVDLLEYCVGFASGLLFESSILNA